LLHSKSLVVSHQLIHHQALTQLNMADIAPLSVIVLLRQLNVGWWEPSIFSFAVDVVVLSENDSNDDD
jgi:hypothetical protein